MIGAIAGDIAGSRFEGGPAPDRGFDLFTAADAVMGGEDFAGRLKTYVRRHPDRGYGGMFLRWAFSAATKGYGSWGNGAPMRVASIGWLVVEEAEADRLAAAQASVSHDHANAIAAAQAVARAILAFRAPTDAEAIRGRLVADFGYDLDPRRALAGGGFDVSAAGTVPAALAAAFSSDSWEDAARTAIGLGGDTDTLACIAGAVAEARHGVPNAVAEQARSYLTPDLVEVLDRFEARVSNG